MALLEVDEISKPDYIENLLITIE